VRELEPQSDQGDDDPVGACSGGAQPLVSPAGAQPVFPGGRPRPGQLLDQLAQRAAADPG
jgi:hypothetical protein